MDNGKVLIVLVEEVEEVDDSLPHQPPGTGR